MAKEAAANGRAGTLKNGNNQHISNGDIGKATNDDKNSTNGHANGRHANGNVSNSSSDNGPAAMTKNAASPRSPAKKDPPSTTPAVRISLKAMTCVLVASMALAFTAGRVARIHLIPPHPSPATSVADEMNNNNAATNASNNNNAVKYDVSAAGEVSPSSNEQQEASVDEDDDDEEEDDDDDEEPTAQHFMIDMSNISEENMEMAGDQLIMIFITFIRDEGLEDLELWHACREDTLGSKETMKCSGIFPNGKGSFWFQTRPTDRAIFLDVFLRTTTVAELGSQDKPLLPLVSHLAKRFGGREYVFRQQTRSDDSNKHGGGGVGVALGKDEFRIQWKHITRGFHTNTYNTEANDLDRNLLGQRYLEQKSVVATAKSPFQSIQIFDYFHPKRLQMDRLLYLDSVVQSRRLGDAAYHEALVHPAMFTHAHPKRVAIIGGGEGATLREALKHKTVEKVVMVEIDKVLVDTSREHLIEWNDCASLRTNNVSTSTSCFDDPRTEMHYTDAVAWFLERFSDEDKINPEDKFDVIIMDALDPSSEVPFSDALYGNPELVKALYNGLTEQGILTLQIGDGPYFMDPPEVFVKAASQLLTFRDNLEDEGFESIKYYSEAWGGFDEDWHFMIAMKDYRTKQNWYANQAQLQRHIQERVFPAASSSSSEGEDVSPFRYFDGATMMTYQDPSRLVENQFCKHDVNDPDSLPPFCDLGHGFDPNRLNVPISNFEVKTSNIPTAGRGVFIKHDYPARSYTAIDESVHSLVAAPGAVSQIQGMADPAKSEAADRWKFFDPYFYGYGFYTDFFGGQSATVDHGILTFINHGCNGTYNVGFQMAVTELTADPEQYPKDVDDESYESVEFNPFVDRNYHLLITCGGDGARWNLQAGDEILDNFLSYASAGWKRAVKDLRAQCSSDTLGSVSSYEAAAAGAKS